MAFITIMDGSAVVVKIEKVLVKQSKKDMRKIISIKKNEDFKKVFKLGKKVVMYCMVFYYKTNDLGISRFGFTASKKIGNAVTRNRIRRLFREACRLNMEKFPYNYDYVLVARKNAANLKYQRVAECLKVVLKKAKLDKGCSN